MTCSNSSDCATTEPGNSEVYTSNACGDPNGNCLCSSGGCVSGTCTDDSYCQQTFGSNSKCENGSCTDNVCTNSDDCPELMRCNGGVCTSISCKSGSDCGFFAKCEGGYCVRKEMPSMLFMFVIIFAALVALFVGYKVYGYKHA